MGWLRETLIKLGWMKKGVVERQTKDRRGEDRRWTAAGEKPTAVHDPRRKKDRRKKSRRH